MCVDTPVRRTWNVKVHMDTKKLHIVLHIDTKKYPLQQSGQNYTAN